MLCAEDASLRESAVLRVSQAMDYWERQKQRLRDVVHSEYRASLMNTTKWEEVKGLIQRLKLGCRVKLIPDTGPLQWRTLSCWQSRGFLDVSGEPVHVLEVEWMEVDSLYRVPRPYVGLEQYEDRAGKLEQGLRAIGAPYTCAARVYRIWGHVPKDESPDFVQST